MRISDWSSDVCSSDLRREDIDQLAPLALAELHLAVGHGEEGVVAAAAHVLTGVELGAALAHEDGASGDGGAVEGLNAEELCCGVAAVPGRTGALGLGHVREIGRAEVRERV